MAAETEIRRRLLQSQTSICVKIHFSLLPLRPTLCVAVASLKFTVFTCSTRMPYCLFHPRLSAGLKKASQEEISNPITAGASTPAAGAPQSEC